jgi:MFS superfamily sulfate permease-like transporter
MLLTALLTFLLTAELGGGGGMAWSFIILVRAMSISETRTLGVVHTDHGFYFRNIRTDSQAHEDESCKVEGTAGMQVFS